MTEAAQVLERGLAELDLEASDQQLSQLLGLAALTETWGQHLNLTGHRTQLRIVERLILDAAALVSVLPPLDTLADLGSGAGYPGLPVAILRPNLAVTLVESRERRHHFQKAAIRELALRNATPLLGRAESLPATPHSGVIAQAMAQPAAALEWMLPWAAPNAWLLVPGGEEVPQVPHTKTSRWIPQPPTHYQVPCSGPARTLWQARTTS